MQIDEPKKECNLVSHAVRELQLLEAESAKDDDPSALDMQKHVTADVLALLRTLSTQGQSGGSIGYILNLFRKLANFESLTPLTGADEEWMEVGDGFFQNVRCGRIFKNESDGRAYDLDGHVTVDPNGCGYTGGSTPTCYIEFPYTLNTKYIPRLNLIPREDDEDEPDYNNFLFKTSADVLDFYESMNIVQPEEEEHVVRLAGSLDYAVICDESNNPVLSVEPDAPGEPEPKL